MTGSRFQQPERHSLVRTKPVLVRFEVQAAWRKLGATFGLQLANAFAGSAQIGLNREILYSTFLAFAANLMAGVTGHYGFAGAAGGSASLTKYSTLTSKCGLIDPSSADSAVRTSCAMPILVSALSSRSTSNLPAVVPGTVKI